MKSAPIASKSIFPCSKFRIDLVFCEEAHAKINYISEIENFIVEIYILSHSS